MGCKSQYILFLVVSLFLLSLVSSVYAFTPTKGGQSCTTNQDCYECGEGACVWAPICGGANQDTPGKCPFSGGGGCCGGNFPPGGACDSNNVRSYDPNNYPTYGGACKPLSEYSGVCKDGLDNDKDSSTDCTDSDCSGLSECTSTPTPMYSPSTNYCGINSVAYASCMCGTDTAGWSYGKYCCGTTSATGYWSTTACETSTYSPTPYTSPTYSYTPYPSYTPPSTSCSSSSLWNCYDSSSCTNVGGQWSISPAAGGSGWCSQKCSSSNIGSCYDQSSCESAGGQWSIPPAGGSGWCSQKCSSSNMWSCYDQTSCTNVGGQWNSNACIQKCSSSNVGSCYDKASCTGAGASWCGTYCTTSSCPTCSSSQSWNCYDDASCSEVNGVWCKSSNNAGGNCNSAPYTCPSCSKDQIWNCYSESECKSVGGYWSSMSKYCNSNPQDETSCKSAGKNWCSSIASTIAYSTAGWCSDTSCPTYACSKTESWNCKTETECKNAGGYWYNNYCSNSPPPKCEYSNPWNCYDKISCTGAGANWCTSQYTTYSTGTTSPSSGWCQSNSCPTYTCSKTEAWNCKGETECKNAGSYWYNNYCSNSPPPKCDASQTWNCYDLTSCTSASGQWCKSGYTATGTQNGYCSSSCPVCSSSQSWNCYSKEDCSGASANWCKSGGSNYYCTSSTCPVCTTGQAWNCYDEVSCKTVGGYWYNNYCSSSPPPQCSSTQPWNCYDKSACTGASGEWCSSPNVYASGSSYTTSTGVASTIVPPANTGWCTSKGSCPYKSTCPATPAVPPCKIDEKLETKYDSDSCVTGYDCRKLTICTAIYKPVCGSDGNTYGNDCEAKAAGVGVQHDGGCLTEAKCDQDLFNPIFECKKNNQNYKFESDKNGCPIPDTVKCIPFEKKCPTPYATPIEEKKMCEKSGGVYAQETDSFGCIYSRCDHSGKENKCKETVSETDTVKIDCESDVRFCSPQPSEEEQASMRTKCTEYGGTFSIATQYGCSYPDCKFEGDVDVDNPFERIECPTNVDIERKSRGCEAVDGRAGISFVGGCKVARCDREELACSADESANEEAAKRCADEGKGLVKKFDSNGCAYASCGTVDQCDKEPPAVSTAKCSARGGEYIVKKDTNGCIDFADCIEPGKRIDEIIVEPVKNVPDTIAILDVTLKMEEIKVSLDKLARNTESLAEYYKDFDQSEYEKFSKVTKMLDGAKVEIDKIKEKLKNKLDSLTVDELTDIKKDLAILKEGVLREVMYLLLGTKEKTTEVASLGDCGSDATCFDKAFKACSPTTFSPEVVGGPSPSIEVLGLINGKCSVTASIIVDNIDYDMKCSIDNYVMGFGESENIAESCSGSMIDLVKSQTSIVQAPV